MINHQTIYLCICIHIIYYHSIEILLRKATGTPSINSLPNDKILDLTKQKAFQTTN